MEIQLFNHPKSADRHASIQAIVDKLKVRMERRDTQMETIVEEMERLVTSQKTYDSIRFRVLDISFDNLERRQRRDSRVAGALIEELIALSEESYRALTEA